MLCLKCEHVTMAYESKIVLSDLSFAVEEGEYLCVVGENGTGKSTLLKGLLGLKKPMSGRIDVGNGLRAGQIGYVPQTTEIQRDFPASVWEVTLSGCARGLGWHPGYGAKEKRLAREKLAALGILDLADKSFRELSGGQRQRVLLARCLCATQKLILLDEPTAGLDLLAEEEFYRLLQKLHEEEQLTVIMVSHAIGKALAYADHILHLSGDGYFYGTTQAYLKSNQGREFMRRQEG